MFNQLFSRSDALTRQLSAPLVEERRRYLCSMCGGRNVHGNPAHEISTLIINRKVPEIGPPAWRPN